MSKLEEIIASRYEYYDRSYIKVKSIEEMMKEYAEYYANECLKLAARNVKFIYGYTDIEGSIHKEIVDLDYEHTFNFKLPKHEEL